MSAPRRQILLFDFPEPQNRLEGLLVGSLERAESGGAVRVLEVLFVARDADDGEIATFRVEGGGGGLVTALTDFRLKAGERGPAGEVSPELKAIGTELGPGQAIVAVHVEHRWAAALDEAVARSGGRPLELDAPRSEDAPDLAECALLAARRAAA